jgi:hypothetical protein
MKKLEVLPLDERITILRKRVANLRKRILAREAEADEFSLETAQRSLNALECERGRK